MSTDSADELLQRLKLRAGSAEILSNHEGNRLEFKQSFNAGNVPAYVRTMLGFANNRGGYIVFGVEDSPRRLCGVKIDSFTSYDSARLTDFLRSHVDPVPDWDLGTIEFQSVALGYICVQQSPDRPLIVTANSGKDLKEGDILYRHVGQTRRISHSELAAIIEERLDRERRAWMKHLGRISEAGPTNVGIIDTVRGIVHGGESAFLIDEDLVDQLKFIREGNFRETVGEPALKLVGELHPVSQVISPMEVPTGIHEIDLLRAAVQDSELDSDMAESYLRATVDRNSHMLPVYRFVSAAGMSASDAAEVVEGAATSYPSNRDRVLKRILGSDKIEPKGALPDHVPVNVMAGGGELVTLVEEARTAMQKRAVLMAALIEDPEAVIAAIDDLPIVRLCEALMHLDRYRLSERKADVFRVVRSLLARGLESMKPAERTDLRKTVAYLDQQLYGESV